MVTRWKMKATAQHALPCGKYQMVITQKGKRLEIRAFAPGGLESIVNTVTEIMSEVLTPQQVESGHYDESDWVFSTEQAAANAYKRAVDLFIYTHDHFEKALDADRREGEWGIVPVETKPTHWDCECKDDYIRPRRKRRCKKCGAERDNQPDGRVNEVRAGKGFVK